jgi:subtilisin family serine protease
MVTLDDETKEVLNTEFARRLEDQGASPLDVLVETEFGEAEAVSQALQNVPNVELATQGVVSSEFVATTMPSEALPTVARLDGVVQVHQDQLVGVKQSDASLPQLPFMRPSTDPVASALSTAAFNIGGVEDKYVGEVGVSRVEIPQVTPAQLPPGDPMKTMATALDDAFGLGLTGEKHVPTQESYDWIRDSHMLDAHDGSSAKVGVVDTGFTVVPPAAGGRTPRLESYVPGEGPSDFMAHGTHTTYTAVGAPASSAWGTVRGVADGSPFGHFKALNTFPGFGKTSWILAAMEGALDWGADVISMSLGGDQQGPLDEDPYAKFIRRRCKENAGDDAGAIFVVAAGNAGPDKWTIGSPGVSEKAITVGSWSLKDGAPAYFSSRGPQGDWYEKNRGRFEDDANRYNTTEFIAPDVAAPGGGRQTKADSDDEGELLHQMSTGWAEGLYDGLKDARASMKGTSMATPAVAGLVARLYDAGIIETAKELKRVAKRNSEPGYHPRAAPGANEEVKGKNVASGFGPLRESVFSP